MSDEETSHLSNLSDGAGCTEIWEHLSEQRAAAEAEESEDDETAEQTAEDSTDESSETDAAGVPCP